MLVLMLVDRFAGSTKRSRHLRAKGIEVVTTSGDRQMGSSQGSFFEQWFEEWTNRASEMVSEHVLHRY